MIGTDWPEQTVCVYEMQVASSVDTDQMPHNASS